MKKQFFLLVNVELTVDETVLVQHCFCKFESIRTGARAECSPKSARIASGFFGVILPTISKE